MEIEVKKVTDWNRVLNAARMTVHKKALDKEPSDKFKHSIMMSEHSPIRLLEFDIIIRDIPYCNMGHFVRHVMGIEKFVTTSREDRTNVPRSERRQTDPVDCQFSVNAQALINISRRRLCSCADKETIKIWNAVKSAIECVDPIVAKYMVRNCIYRGFCPEDECCGYRYTQQFNKELSDYRKLIERI